MASRLLRAPLTWVAVTVLAAGTAFGLYWFQPWKLVTDTEVNEELAVVASEAPSSPANSAPAAGSTPDEASAPAAGPTIVRSGEFITHEHDTSGTARIIRTADGKLRLELVGLATSNGPDLRVWLTDQPVRSGEAGWHVFDDGHWVELGRLKGNRGDQAYDIPAEVDLDGLTSVSIWCKRFAVSFGAAPLATA
ncbi:DM13 domain-containing protein [Salinispora fenicalii]|uniref:DM13 domain-containing protein n=1 Tax=Salinispora fenicalii TaxID=1137263 RepID=UPI00036C506C|nr:DM13 domain-containing protein [Salinispora fenicalii]